MVLGSSGSQNRPKKKIDSDDELEEEESSTKNGRADKFVPVGKTFEEKNEGPLIEEVVEDEQAVEDEVEEELAPEEPAKETPEIRKLGAKKIDFTERKFPHMPARESHMREPPYPKSKKIDKVKEEDRLYVDIEERDPVWLKDKGDHFYKQHDYNSALSAYCKAIENDRDFLKGYLNRATAFLRVRSYELAVEDCNDIEKRIDALPTEERADEFYTLMMARMLVKRGTAHAWLSHWQEAEDDYKKALADYKGVLGKEITYVEKDLERIQTRRKSQDTKATGDILYTQGEIQKALELYLQAAEEDPYNEYAFANISLIHLKNSNYEECVRASNRALDIINGFQNDTKSFSKDNRLEVKLLLRRGKSLQMLGEHEYAKQDLDLCVRLEPQNSEAKALLKRVQDVLDGALFTSYREQANGFLGEKRFADALEMYEKCLKITRKATTLENISVFVNKTACLLALEKHDRTVEECNNALRLIKNYRHHKM